MSKQYTHRNGKTTPPTISGTFDFFGKRDGRHLGAKTIEYQVVEEFPGKFYVMEGIPWALEFYEGRWWGPK